MGKAMSTGRYPLIATLDEDAFASTAEEVSSSACDACWTDSKRSSTAAMRVRHRIADLAPVHGDDAHDVEIVT